MAEVIVIERSELERLINNAVVSAIENWDATRIKNEPIYKISDTKTWLDRKEAAKYLNCSLTKLNDLINAGLLQYQKIGRNYSFKTVWLDEAVETGKLSGNRWLKRVI